MVYQLRQIGLIFAPVTIATRNTQDGPTALQSASKTSRKGKASVRNLQIK